MSWYQITPPQFVDYSHTRILFWVLQITPPGQYKPRLFCGADIPAVQYQPHMVLRIQGLGAYQGSPCPSRTSTACSPPWYGRFVSGTASSHTISLAIPRDQPGGNSDMSRWWSRARVWR
eukprot:2567875-Rhodomonas_salina.2